MLLTRERAKAKLWIAAQALAGMALFVVLQPTESRADVLQWLTDLVQPDTDIESAALSGAELPADAIVTGRDETRVLYLGRDVLELYPSTAVTFVESEKDTTVRLITGTIRAKVAKRKKDQKFDVKTLMLVATVKGTEFEVSAIGEASAVSVYEGRVAVKAAARVGGIDVTPGKTATVTRADNEPSLGKTPPGGAAAAAKALARGHASTSRPASRDDPDDDDGKSERRDINVTGRAPSGNPSNSGNGSRGGADTDGGEGEGGDDHGGEHGERGEHGESGENGDDD